MSAWAEAQTLKATGAETVAEVMAMRAVDWIKAGISESTVMLAVAEAVAKGIGGGAFVSYATKVVNSKSLPASPRSATTGGAPAPPTRFPTKADRDREKIERMKVSSRLAFPKPEPEDSHGQG